MADLNLDLDYFTHPKTLRLIGLLGKGSEVLPIRLWCWCAKYHAESGEMTGYSAEEIESVLGWWGKPGELIRSMVKVGFCEWKRGGNGGRTLLIHDWSQHQGHIAPLKERARKAANARWNRIKDECTSNATSNAQASSKQCSKQCSLPNHTIPNQEREKTPDTEPNFAESLDTPEVREAWRRFEQHRKEIRHKLTQLASEGARRKLFELSRGQPDVAVAIIQQSIDNGWQGLFELKENTNGKSHRSNNTNPQFARATFRHGPDEIKRLAELKESLDRRDRERGERTGDD
jgi:hypothetical protein